MRYHGYWSDPESGFTGADWWGSLGRRRWKRRMRRGILKYVLLKLLTDLPRHGYDLIRAVREHGWAGGPGSIYPILGVLERAGYVESLEEDGRRTYKVTEKGKRLLQEHVEEIAGFFSERDADEEPEPGDDLREALMRLTKAVTQLGETSKAETIQRVRDLLDRTRKEIYILLAQE